MRRNILVILATFSVPLFLFMNVWQSQKYMSKYFDAKSLIYTQEQIVLDNKRLLNRVAELESPSRIVAIGESKLGVKKIDDNKVIKLKVVLSNE